MPVGIDPSDRKLLLIAGSVLLGMLCLFVAVAPPGGEPGDGLPSTYSPGSGGARAAYLLLQELRMKVQRWEQPPTELPEDAEGALLVLANPLLAPTKKEQEALRNFVENGGQILFTGARLGAFFPEAKLSFKPPGKDWQTYAAKLPSRYTRGAAKVTLRPQAEWSKLDATQLELYGDAEGAVVVSWRMGDGQLLWWAGPTPLTNAGITKEGNLSLFLEAVKSPVAEESARRLYWDEYFHGQRSSLWSYVQKTPVPMGLVQLALLGLAVLFTFSRRSGPVVRPAGVSRLSPLEFVDTLGGLYQRAGAAPAAVNVAYQRFRGLLTRQLRLPPVIADASLAKAAGQRLGQRTEEISELLKRAAEASRAHKLIAGDALILLRELEELEKQMGLKKRQTQEKT